MKTLARIERALEKSVKAGATGRAGCKAPPKLADALRYAVFPGGARVRPRLTLAVANACGEDVPRLAEAAAVSVELLHCASLVHDDMPCFDDADLRRGVPSVHVQFGEPLALLTGDALIVLAFETLAHAAQDDPRAMSRLAPLTTTIAQAVGMPCGIVAGQGWESEEAPDLDQYHRAKTGALFVGAAVAGAVASGSDPSAWRTLGEKLGSAYQVADDLRDAFSSVEEIGKPCSQDQDHARPNAVAKLGKQDALAKLQALVGGAIAAIPDCPGHGQLEALIHSEAKRLMPKQLAQSAA